MTTLPLLFNSDVETGLRTLIVLEALHPRRCSLSELVWFDYVVVNTGLFDGGPESLHPATDVATGELLVRRHVLQEGIRLLRLLHLAEEIPTADGFVYVSGEEAPTFLDHLSTRYHSSLKLRAEWLARAFGSMSGDEIKRVLDNALGKWTAQLQTEAFPIGVHP